MDLAYSISDEYLNGFIEGARRTNVIAVDTEANGEDVRDSRGFATGLSIAFRPAPGMSIIKDYFAFRHPDHNLDHTALAKLKDLVESHPCIVYHHAKYDLVSLETLGIHHKGFFYDTMNMAHLIDQNRPFTGYGLDSLTKFYLDDPGKRKSPEFQGWLTAYGWAKMPAALIREYASYDTDLTLRLFEHLKFEWDKQGLDKFWTEQEMDFIRVIAKMEQRGIRIDTEVSRRELSIGEVRMAEITDILGLNPGSPTQLKKLLIDELGLPVVKTTKGGKASFDKFAMEQYEELLEQMGDSRASLILEYRGWQKTCSSNYKAYLELLSPDGRLRPNYKLHGTVTGRLSCEKPNLQQIPKVSEKPWNGSLKRAFIPREGYKLFEGDYSQIEFRLAAAYGREESLLAIFNDPTRDIFTEMAATLGMPRNSVKTLTYTIQFGGGVNRIKQVFGVTEQEARAMLDNYWNSYRGIYKVTQLAKSKAMRTGKVKLWSGRTRKFLYPEDEARKAFNSAIQGGAADIVKRAMVRLYNTVDNDDCQMLLQVHDSVVFEIREGTEDKYLPLIKETMEAVEPDFGVHFAVDVHEWGK